MLLFCDRPELQYNNSGDIDMLNQLPCRSPYSEYGLLLLVRVHVCKESTSYVFNSGGK